MAGPEVPFPMKMVEEVLCRECPFPSQANWTGTFDQELDKWQKEFLKKLSAKSDPGGAIENTLKGMDLVVLKPGQGPHLDLRPNRVTITVNAGDKIIGVSVGR